MAERLLSCINGSVAPPFCSYFSENNLLTLPLKLKRHSRFVFLFQVFIIQSSSLTIMFYESNR